MVSLIVVCHRSSGVLVDCVASFRRQLEEAGLEGEVVAVEQSENDLEAAAVADVGVDRIVVRPNRGYAAGLNAGADQARGDVLLLANPDIRFLDGSVDALANALRAGFDVVGPRLVWDQDAGVLLPVAEDPAPMAELRRNLRRRWQRLWVHGLSAEIERSWGVWTADRPVTVPAVRGPLMAVHRDSLARLGPLDEEYFLYYEETDWLWRARRRGARLGVAPGAAVIHRWGHATEHHPDAARIERESRHRFFARSYGPLWRRLLAWTSSDDQRAGVQAQPIDGPEEIPDTGADLWLLSIYPHLMPAIGWLQRLTPPPEVRELTSRGRWYCLAVVRAGRSWRPLSSWTWERA
jgi:GT2 family glycosyltransferase